MSQTRPSVLAGEWYPDDPAALRAQIREILNRVPRRQIHGKVVGLISPHAGYMYSGFTAAHGYSLLAGRSFDVVVILSPFHSYPAGRYMVHSASGYETPLGKVAVAGDLVERLSSMIDLTRTARESEHSIEIQLPFLQTVLKSFSILPVMAAGSDVWGVEDMVRALVEILAGKKALLIASSDLHHLHSLDAVKKGDEKVAAAIGQYDLKDIRSVLEPDSCTVCGKIPISIVMEAARLLGADRAEVLYRSNSRDEYAGDYSGTYTVGYLSAALTGGGGTSQIK
jgi:AmmeMemoRadiSam system protein B